MYTYAHYEDGKQKFTYNSNYPLYKNDTIIGEAIENVITIDSINIRKKINHLQAQLKAQTERSDFIEDCIAEMAGVVYNTEETTT